MRAHRNAGSWNLPGPFAWHDFRQYELDAPFPDVLPVAERGFRTQAEKIVALARGHGYTLRQTGAPRIFVSRNEGR